MRTAEENPKAKEKILDAAQELMMAKGFVATTLDEICEASGVSKGSLFHYFKNKEDLGKATLMRYGQKMTEMKQAALDDIQKNESDPLKRIFQYLNFMSEMVKKKGDKGGGCLVGTFAQEISQTHPELREVCQQGFKYMAESIRTDLEEAKIKYNPEGNIDTQSFADFFVSIAQGSMLLVKTHENIDIMLKNLELFKQHLQFVFKRK